MPVVNRVDHEKGLDFQGIPWALFGSRSQFLGQRHQKYRPHRSTEYEPSSVRLEAHQCSDTADVFGFTSSFLQQKPAIYHFQLLNLIWASDSSHVYYLSKNIKREGWEKELSREQLLIEACCYLLL